MASIKESTDANGQSKYYVHWKDEKSGHGRRRIFKNIDDAAHLFWQKQNIELDCRTASWTGIDHSWTFRKLILFYLGYQAGKLEKNIIRLSSYTKCRHDLLAVDGPILEKIFSISAIAISLIRFAPAAIAGFVRLSSCWWKSGSSLLTLLTVPRAGSVDPSPYRHHHRSGSY